MKSKNIILENIPNMLTISRIILSFVIVYMIFTDTFVFTIIVVFAIAALTDFFDGKLARWFGWQSEFGRKADMVADRFLWIGTSLAFIFYFGLRSELSWFDGVQILLIMTRELICTPYAIIAFFSGNPLPQARHIAKVTTFIQGFAIPSLILSIYYPIFLYMSVPLSVACCVTGFLSALYYMRDTKNIDKKQKKR